MWFWDCSKVAHISIYPVQYLCLRTFASERISSANLRDRNKSFTIWSYYQLMRTCNFHMCRLFFLDQKDSWIPPLISFLRFSLTVVSLTVNQIHGKPHTSNEVINMLEASSINNIWYTKVLTPMLFYRRKCITEVQACTKDLRRRRRKEIVEASISQISPQV